MFKKAKSPRTAKQNLIVLVILIVLSVSGEVRLDYRIGRGSVRVTYEIGRIPRCSPLVPVSPFRNSFLDRGEMFDLSVTAETFSALVLAHSG